MNDDIRPRGTVQVDCVACEWSFWVDPLHPMLEPGARIICPVCTSEEMGKPIGKGEPAICEMPECGETVGVIHVERTGGPDGNFCPECLADIDRNGAEPVQW